jgi:hypothetical protein
MTDKRIDELVEQEAKRYNAPGDVPREEIWNRIQAARRDGLAKPQTSSSARRLWMWTGAAIAAAAMLALGISLGRMMERRDTTAQLAAGTSRPEASGDSIQSQVANVETRAPTTHDSRPTTDVVRDLRRATSRTAERARELASASASRDSAQVGADALQYRLVLLEHLAGAEAMITAFRTSARTGNGNVDAQLAAWSKDLLSTTRMLESSRAAADPVMKRLLEDLDLVLSEITHYSSTGTYQQADLDVIEHAITQRAVMTRLRTTIPTT